MSSYVVGGSIRTYTQPDSTMAHVYYGTNLNPNLRVDAALQLKQMEIAVLRQGPGNRNINGEFPIAAMTPTTLGTAGAPVVGAALNPVAVEVYKPVGHQINKLY